MEIFAIILGIVVAVVIFAFIRISERRKNEIIECGSCRNRMTFGAFKERSGCPRCGSDLVNRTGEQANRNSRI